MFLLCLRKILLVFFLFVKLIVLFDKLLINYLKFIGILVKGLFKLLVMWLIILLDISVLLIFKLLGYFGWWV